MDPDLDMLLDSENFDLDMVLAPTTLAPRMNVAHDDAMEDKAVDDEHVDKEVARAAAAATDDLDDSSRSSPVNITRKEPSVYDTFPAISGPTSLLFHARRIFGSKFFTFSKSCCFSLSSVAFAIIEAAAQSCWMRNRWLLDCLL
jgi:hypothetical protein